MGDFAAINNTTVYGGRGGGAQDAGATGGGIPGSVSAYFSDSSAGMAFNGAAGTALGIVVGNMTNDAFGLMVGAATPGLLAGVENAAQDGAFSGDLAPSPGQAELGIGPNGENAGVPAMPSGGNGW